MAKPLDEYLKDESNLPTISKIYRYNRYDSSFYNLLKIRFEADNKLEHKINNKY